MIAIIVGLHVASMVGFGLGTVLIAHFLRQRRPPSGNRAWMLAIGFCPYLVLPIYLFFGGRKMQAMARRKPRIEFHDGHTALHQLPALEALLRNHRLPAARSGHSLTLYPTAKERRAGLFDLIAGARHSLNLCLYILHPDPVGREVVAALAQRAREGVTVRLLLDGVGSLHTGKRHLRPLQSAGGKTAYFMPVFRRPLRGRTNLRNHRKVAIADHVRVWAGGANVGAEYLEAGAGSWRDLSFLLEGPAVHQYSTVFRSDWEFATGERLHAAHIPEPVASPGAVVQVVPSGPDVAGDPLPDALLTVAQSARERLWIATPYFIPDDAFCRTLALTAHRGVDVRVILPARSDHLLVDLAGRSYLQEIHAAGGRVLFEPRMTHAKGVLVDNDVAILGSANVDMRSLLLNYEMALFAYDAQSIRSVEHWMETLQRDAHPHPITSGGWRDLLGGLARLVAPEL
jgi:cardiolipin synthase A/B